jgi:hypothetical protein
MAFFTLGKDNRWSQKRQIKERMHVQAIVQLRVQAGKASALKRKKTAPTHVAPPFQHPDPERKNGTETQTSCSWERTPLGREGSAEGRNTTSGNSDGAAAPTRAQERARPRRAFALPEDWTPSELDLAFARKLKLDAVYVTGMFGNYWWSRGKPMKDWHAAWRQWCLKEAGPKPARPTDDGFVG